MKNKLLIFYLLTAMLFSSSLLLSLSSVNPHSPALAQTIMTAKDFLTYDNAKYGIKMQYPASWNKAEGGQSYVARFTTSDQSARLSITVLPSKNSNNSLDKYTNSFIQALKSNFTDFFLIRSASTTLSGNTAHEIVYARTDPSTDKSLEQLRQIWILKNDHIYMITYNAAPEVYDIYLPTIQKMIDSFQLTK